MKKRKKLMWLALIVSFLAAVAIPGHTRAAAQPDEQEAVLVGRISHVEGELLRFVPDEKDWVATVKDAPFGMEDALYSGENARAEFIMPNNTWARIDDNTQVQMIAITPDVTEMDMASGVGRFYNRSSDGIIKVTTPFGFVTAEPGSSFDLYVGDDSVEVITLAGDVSFVHDADQSRYDVQAGSASLIADNRVVSSGDGNLDADWDDWNASRNSLWAKRFEVKGDSTEYLPEPLRDDAYTLEENGQWEQVQYEGETRRVWRPARVAADWAPFSAGRWTVYYGDPCWVPDEPFGYVTHHYGNWILVNDAWYWSPPVARVRVAAGPVGIGIGWTPGRVGWMYTDSSVAWVPLAPNEIYYSHRHWGRNSMVVTNVNIGRVNINISNYRYINRAVVINQTNMFAVNNYYRVRETHINRTTIINNFRAGPVVSNTVIRNYSSNRARYNFTNVNVVRKPHQTVINRIQHNEKLARQDRVVNARNIEQQVLKSKQGRIDSTAPRKTPPPRVTSRLVDSKDVAKPQKDVKFQQNDMKRKARNIDQSSDKRVITQDQKLLGPQRDRKPGQDDKVRPPREQGPGQVREPGQPRGPREDTDRVRPTKPGQERGQPGATGTPREDAGAVKPTRPGQEREPGQPRSPREDTDRVRPTKPGQEREQPGATRAPREDAGAVKPGSSGQERSVGRPDQSPRPQVEPQRQTPPQQRPVTQEQRTPVQQQQQQRPQVQEQRAPAQQQRPQVQEQRAPAQQQRPQVQEQRAPVQQQRPQVQEQRAPAQQQRPQVQEQRAPAQQQRPQVQEQRAPAQQQRPQVQEQRAPKQQPQPQQQPQAEKGKKKNKDGKEE